MRTRDELLKAMASAKESGNESAFKLASLELTLLDKRTANEAREKVEAEAAELAKLERDIEIEDKLKEAYDAGVKPEQILDLTWRGVGRCIARIPRDANWRDFAKKSGILQGELKNNPALHEELADAVMLVPNGKTFLALARELNPHAPFDLTSAVSTAMRAARNHEGN